MPMLSSCTGSMTSGQTKTWSCLFGYLLLVILLHLDTVYSADSQCCAEYSADSTVCCRWWSDDGDDGGGGGSSGGNCTIPESGGEKVCRTCNGSLCTQCHAGTFKLYDMKTDDAAATTTAASTTTAATTAATTTTAAATTTTMATTAIVIPTTAAAIEQSTTTATQGRGRKKRETDDKVLSIADMLDMTSFKCVSRCPDYYHGDEESRTCIVCNMTICKSCKSHGVCSECVATLVMRTNGTCVEKPDQTLLIILPTFAIILVLALIIGIVSYCIMRRRRKKKKPKPPPTVNELGSTPNHYNADQTDAEASPGVDPSPELDPQVTLTSEGASGSSYATVRFKWLLEKVAPKPSAPATRTRPHKTKNNKKNNKKDEEPEYVNVRKLTPDPNPEATPNPNPEATPNPNPKATPNPNPEPTPSSPGAASPASPPGAASPAASPPSEEYEDVERTSAQWRAEDREDAMDYVNEDVISELHQQHNPGKRGGRRGGRGRGGGRGAARSASDRQGMRPNRTRIQDGQQQHPPPPPPSRSVQMDSSVPPPRAAAAQGCAAAGKHGHNYYNQAAADAAAVTSRSARQLQYMQ